MLNKTATALTILLLLNCLNDFAERNYSQSTARFKVMALYENGGHHVAYSEAARISDSNFKVDYIQQPKKITEALLKKYPLSIQSLHNPFS